MAMVYDKNLGFDPLGIAGKTGSAFEFAPDSNADFHDFGFGDHEHTKKKFWQSKKKKRRKFTAEEKSEWLRSQVKLKNLKQRKSRKVIAKQNDKVKARLKFLTRCGTSMGYGAGKTSVMKTDTHAFYKGLNHCKSIWACPVCSEKILKKRQKEIDQALGKAYSSGMKVAMVTFTVWHSLGMSLDSLAKTFKKAVKRFNKDRQQRNRFAKIGLHWKIEGFEVTVGYQNGWHFHLHTLWIVDEQTFQMIGELEEEFQKHWLHVYKQSGGKVPKDREEIFLQRGFVVSRNSDGSVFECHSGKYICGWGSDNELTGLSTKKCKNGNRTPFELLSDEMTEQDEKLWIEYCLATKGKRRIIFSRGLKEWAGIETKTDDTLLEETELEEENNAREICYFDVESWEKIVEADKRKTVLQDILDVAYWKEYDGVYTYCLENGLPPPKLSDEGRAKMEEEMLGGAGCIFK